MLTKNQTSFEKVRSTLFLSLLLILLVLFLNLIKPFFFSLFWATIIAILVHPFYKKINRYIDTPALSALISLILVIVLIFIPLALFSFLVIQQSIILYASFSPENIISNVQHIASWLRDTPAGPFIQEVSLQWTQYVASIAKTVSIFLFENIKSITQNSVKFIFMLFIMLYTLYFFFKDGEKIVNKLSYVSPLGNNYEKLFFEKFRSTAISTLKSSLMIGGIQGVMGAILFWTVGIKGAFLWGVIMMAMSIIPALGSFTVWLPAAIIMLATNNIWQGIVILIVGAFAISTSDNLLRPIFISKGTEMHPLVILFSTLGGIFIFGISGFIIGPILAALFFSFISIYTQYYKNELEKN